MISRRDFLQAMAALTAGVMLTSCESQTRSTSPLQVRGIKRDRLGELLPQRKLGRTGLAVTMLGLGGGHVDGICNRLGEAAAQETIEAAVEGGVRFFDNAESYGKDGLSETLYGKYLTPKYRDCIVLQTKSHVPSPADTKQTREHLEGSLKRLKVDYVDIWLLHSITTPQDADKRVSSGVVDYFHEVKRKGLARHIGFSGHYDPVANNYFIDALAGRGTPLDTCQMAVNVLDPSYASFIVNTMPKLLDAGYGVCAMKTLAGGGFFRKPEITKNRPNWKAVVPDRMSLADAMHFVWSLPVSVAMSGPDTPDQFREIIGLARSFGGMTEQRRKELIDKVADLAADRNPGQQTEWFRIQPPKPGAATQHAWLHAEPGHVPPVA